MHARDPFLDPATSRGAIDNRIRVLETPFAAVDDLRCPDSDGKQGPRGFSPDFQICLPYRGLFVWHVGHDDVVGEANQILFVSGGEAFRVSRPARVAVTVS